MAEKNKGEGKGLLGFLLQQGCATVADSTSCLRNSVLFVGFLSLQLCRTNTLRCFIFTAPRFVHLWWNTVSAFGVMKIWQDNLPNVSSCSYFPTRWFLALGQHRTENINVMVKMKKKLFLCHTRDCDATRGRSKRSFAAACARRAQGSFRVLVTSPFISYYDTSSGSCCCCKPPPCCSSNARHAATSCAAFWNSRKWFAREPHWAARAAIVNACLACCALQIGCGFWFAQGIVRDACAWEAARLYINIQRSAGVGDLFVGLRVRFQLHVRICSAS